MAEVFISYAREDQNVANALSALLSAEGQHVYFDQALAAGEDFSNESARALTASDAVVVLLSRNSNRSRLVESDLRNALKENRIIIPVLLDEEATSNWVWPLISDRAAIKLEAPTQINEVVRQVNRAIGYSDARELKPFGRRASRWVTVIVAVLSAVAGALVVWLAM